MLKNPASFQPGASPHPIARGTEGSGSPKMERFLARSARLSQAFLAKALGEPNANKGLGLSLLSLEFARLSGNSEAAKNAAKEAARRQLGFGRLHEAKCLLEEFSIPTTEKKGLVAPLFRQRNSIPSAVAAHRLMVWDIPLRQKKQPGTAPD